MCIHICVCICIYIYIYICTYTYVHTLMLYNVRYIVYHIMSYYM